MYLGVPFSFDENLEIEIESLLFLIITTNELNDLTHDFIYFSSQFMFDSKADQVTLRFIFKDATVTERN